MAEITDAMTQPIQQAVAGEDSSSSRGLEPAVGGVREPAEVLAERRLLHVAAAIWHAEWDEEFPAAGTIQHALALQMAVAATEALAECMEWDR